MGFCSGRTVRTLPTTPAAVITAIPLSMPSFEPLLIVIVLEEGDDSLPITWVMTEVGDCNLRWIPSVTLEQGLRRTFQWLQEARGRKAEV